VSNRHTPRGPSTGVNTHAQDCIVIEVLRANMDATKSFDWLRNAGKLGFEFPEAGFTFKRDEGWKSLARKSSTRKKVDDSETFPRLHLMRSFLDLPSSFYIRQGAWHKVR
jgi:hypothetical protein